MHCAGCVNSIQKYVSDLKGVSKCEVNLAAEKAILEFDPSLVNLPTIEKAIEEAGYKVVYEKLTLKIGGITDSSDADRLENKIMTTEGVKYASVNYGNGHVLVEYISFVPFAGSDLAAYILFGCASVVQFVTGSRFYAGAYRISKMKSANMDTLVVTGTTAAYIFSVYNTFPTISWHNIYYDAAAVVITFIILGKYLENKTKGKASSIIKKMLELQPKMTRIRKDGNETEVSIELIKTGDIIVVRPGEKIPVDSIVLEGSSVS